MAICYLPSLAGLHAVNQIALHRVPSILPLSLLRAMQEADHLPEVAGEPFGELASVRFGGSETVAAQVDRYSRIHRRGDLVDATEVIGLLSLVARRPDADLVLADAGRMAGQMAAGKGAGSLRRIAPASIGRWADIRSVRRLCRELFGVTVHDEGHATWDDQAALGDGPLAGATCRMIGAATAEVMHICTGYEGALFHVSCRRDGDDVCAWTTESQTGD